MLVHTVEADSATATAWDSNPTYIGNNPKDNLLEDKPVCANTKITDGLAILFNQLRDKSIYLSV